MMQHFDVIVVGAGAAGLMCAIEAAKRGRRVLVLERSNKPGKKILMSGGGRCNFTNLHIDPSCYQSHNPHFCKSALRRYSQWDFIAKVEAHGIPYHEKTLGQLFCDHSSKDIVQMLLSECEQFHVRIQLKQDISMVDKRDSGYWLRVNGNDLICDALVIASGGLSIPTLGSSPFGFKLAEQFGLDVYPLRAGLVPFTLHSEEKARFSPLSGVSMPCEVRCNGQSFCEALLFTHRGLSGPAMLQISSYWSPGDTLQIDLLPSYEARRLWEEARSNYADSQFQTFLSQLLSKRFVQIFFPKDLLSTPMRSVSESVFNATIQQLKEWVLRPNQTEGYRTAEVTLGGVDCNAISSKTFACHAHAGLYFIGEVLDVTGWLGGYNFQWAWSSGWAAGQVV